MEKLVKLLDDFNRDLSPYAGEAKYTIWDDSVELAKYLIENDVRPVVHAKWVRKKEKDTFGFIYHRYCSNCNSEEESIGLVEYCSSCGAKMDLE